MADKIEMSLDEIIILNKNSRGRGGSGRSHGIGRGSFRSLGRSPAIASVQRGRGGISRSSSRGGVNTAWKHALFEGTMGLAKLVVSNLDFRVTDSDIQELFAEFGPLRSAALHYDGSGRSLGIADVIFERKSDAIKAMKEYDGVPLDGRIMNIQLATPHVPSPMTRSIGERMFQYKREKGDRTRASRGRGGERAQRTSHRKQPTAEELDAELDAYIKEREA